MSTQTQPAPVLAWYRKVKTAYSDAVTAWILSDDSCQANEPDLAAIIAAHDPHQAQNATTVRLLEEALPYVARDDFGKLLAREIRAHLPALQQEGAAK